MAREESGISIENPFHASPAGSPYDGGSVLEPGDVQEGIRIPERPVEILLSGCVPVEDLHPLPVEPGSVGTVSADEAARLMTPSEQQPE